MRKQKIVVSEFLLILMFIISLCGFYALSPVMQTIQNHSLHEKTVANWTYMVYCDADNNLDSYGLSDVNEMEYGYNDAVSSQVNVITFIDREYSGAKTYKIKHDTSSSIVSTILSTGFPSEPNMGSKTTLKNFIMYCFNNYPAQKYVLDLWDHGGGIFGICWDDSSSSDRLSFDEVDEAITEACVAASETIEILAMDACLMQMLEINYECREYVDFIVASEETIPGYGYPYDLMISSLCASPSQTAQTYAVDMVNDYHNDYTSSYDTTLSAVDVRSSSINSLMGAFNTFTAALIEQINVYGQTSAIASARAATQEFYYDIFGDLYDFAYEAKARIGNAYFDMTCDWMMGNISSAVLNSKQHNNPQAHGISIYFPDNSGDYDSGYSTVIDLGQETEWDTFLTTFYYGPSYHLSLQSHSFDDDPSIDAGNDGDDIADQGETLNVTLSIKNTGSVVASNVNGTLSCTNGNITIIVNFQDYGTIGLGQTISHDFQFNVSQTAPNNLVITFQFLIKATFVVGWAKPETFQLVINATDLDAGDSFDTAILITPGTYESSLPGPDPTDGSAWYKIVIQVGDYLEVTINTAAAGTDFDAYIYNPSGSIVAYAIGVSYPDYCAEDCLSSGEYRIRFRPYSGSGAYTFTIELTPASEPSPDPPPDDDVTGSSFATAITILEDESTQTGYISTAADNDTMYYRIYLMDDEQVVAHLHADDSTDFDLYLYNPAQSLLDYSAGTIYPEIVTSGSYRQMGYYYIVVISYSGSGEYELEVTRSKASSFFVGSEVTTAISMLIGFFIIGGLFLFKRRHHHKNIPFF